MAECAGRPPSRAHRAATGRERGRAPPPPRSRHAPQPRSSPSARQALALRHRRRGVLLLNARHGRRGKLLDMLDVVDRERELLDEFFSSESGTLVTIRERTGFASVPSTAQASRRLATAPAHPLAANRLLGLEAAAQRPAARSGAASLGYRPLARPALTRQLA